MHDNTTGTNITICEPDPDSVTKRKVLLCSLVPQSHAQLFIACSTVKRRGPGTFPHVSTARDEKLGVGLGTRLAFVLMYVATKPNVWSNCIGHSH